MEVLAAGIVGFLGNFLVQLLKSGGDKAAEVAGDEIGKSVGEGSWGLAQRIWAKLHPKLAERPGGLEAAKEAAAAPKDPDAQAALRLAVQRVLEQDEGLATELEGLMAEAKGLQVVSAGGEGAVAMGEGVHAESGGVAAGRDVDVKGDVRTGGT